MKKLFFALFFWAIVLPQPIFAGHDITITCSSSGPCLVSGELPFLEARNIYPGFVQSPPQQLTAVNQSLTDSCVLQLQAGNLTGSTILSDVVDITITSSEGTLYQDQLSNLLSPVALGTIDPDSSLDLYWTTSLPSTLGNEYQSLATSIDFDFHFSCGESETSQVAGISIGGGTDGHSPPVCHDPQPGIPQNLTATDLGSGQVRLDWTQVPPPVTSYLVAYGPGPGNYLYGNPDIGLTNNYTVGSLTPGAQYCFYVRAQNGCAPGDRSTEVCINSSSTIPALNAPAPGFTPGVLGSQTTSVPSPATATPSLGDIFGTTSDCQRFWLPILFLLALLINHLYLVNQAELRSSDRSPSRFVIPLLLSLLAYTIDWYLLSTRCCLITDVYCRFFWLGNIFAVLLPFWYYYRHVDSRGR